MKCALWIPSLLALFFSGCGGGPQSHSMAAVFLNGQSTLLAEYSESSCQFSVGQDYVSFNVALSTPETGLDTTNSMNFSVHETDVGPAFSSQAMIQMGFLFSQLNLVYHNIREDLLWISGSNFPNLNELTPGQTHAVHGTMRVQKDTILNPEGDGSLVLPAQDIVFDCDATVELASEPT